MLNSECYCIFGLMVDEIRFRCDRNSTNYSSIARITHRGLFNIISDVVIHSLSGTSDSKLFGGGRVGDLEVPY